MVGDDTRAAHGGAADGHEAARDDGSQTEVAAAGRLDDDQLALSTTDPGSEVVAASGLVGDLVEVRVVVVEHVHLVVHVEQADGSAAENAFGVRHHGSVPFQGVLSEDDVLGGFDLVQDILGMGEAREHGQTGHHIGG